MAVTAESVVVEVIARLDKAEGGIKKLDATFTSSTNHMQAAARTLDANLARVAANSTDSFNRIGAGSRKAADDFDRNSARIANGQRNIARQFADIGAQASSGDRKSVV